MSEPTHPQLRAHQQRITTMFADPECVGELLLVAIGMARSVDLADPPFRADGTMPLGFLAQSVYGRYATLPTQLCYPHGITDRAADPRPRQRLLGVFYADRRRYRPEDVDRFHSQSCARPMVRRDGLCGRDASANHTKQLTDPVTGQRQWVAACSQPACQGWMRDLLTRNRTELDAHPAPRPMANVGGVLERHLPEIDWWKVWQHVDPRWTPPPEGRPFEPPKLRLLLGEPDADTVAVRQRPALAVVEGGWR